MWEVSLFGRNARTPPLQCPAGSEGWEAEARASCDVRISARCGEIHSPRTH